MADVDLCGGFHAAQRQRKMQISNGFCVHFFDIFIGSMSDSVNEP